MSTHIITVYDAVRNNIRLYPKTWLITGVAGFIGSNLLEDLLKLGQYVIGLDNFSTGKRENLCDVQTLVGESLWKNFKFIEGDIRHLDTCRTACKGVEIILHHAALGSVPRSIEDPLLCNENNVNGTLTIFKAALDEKVKRIIYASSSAVYGDHPELPKVEEVTGAPLSPYAVSKVVNELYAQVFSHLYGLNTIGLRYFNVFGARQDPNGTYAAVIPQWIAALCSSETVYINGSGETSRDFCYIDNVVQANLLAATTNDREAVNQIYNVACGRRTTLTELYFLLSDRLKHYSEKINSCKPVYREVRPGDIMHSHADIGKATRLLGYDPSHYISGGLDAALGWYIKNLSCVTTDNIL